MPEVGFPAELGTKEDIARSSSLKTLTFNIETVGIIREGLSPALPNKDDAKAPSNYKDPLKIAEAIEKDWMRITHAYNESLEQMSLSPLTSEICCIGWKWDNEKTVTLVATDPGDEKKILNEFVAQCFGEKKPFELVSFNGKSFDLPLIAHACLRHGLTYPFRPEATKRYATNYHYDMYEQLTFGQMKGGRLKEFALLHGTTPILHDGSMIGDFMKNKQYDSVHEHCSSNIEATYQLFKKTREFWLI